VSHRLAVSLAAFAILFSGAAAASSAEVESSYNELKTYPAAMKGYQRHVLHLKAREDEREIKVEILPGIMLEDDCNIVSFSTPARSLTVKGSGYPYLVIKWNGSMQTTLMGCDELSTKKEFIEGNSILIGYNSLLPVVVFAPKGLSVRYRIRSAGTNARLDASVEIPADRVKQK
jgi:ecotin